MFAALICVFTQISICMYPNTGEAGTPLVKFIIETVGMDMLTHQFDSSIVMYIGRIYLQLCQFQGTTSLFMSVFL